MNTNTEKFITFKATFTGGNSLGYENSKEYLLNLDSFKGFTIVRLDGTGKCKYSSISAFLKNWNNIKIISYN